MRAYVTDRDGGVDEVRGTDGYLARARIEAMDLPAARYQLSITQAVTVRPDGEADGRGRRAPQGGRTLHDHAAHLLTVRDGVVAEWWMVEALPAESDEFWST